MATAESKGYTVRIDGEGLSLDQEVTRNVALRVLNLVLGSEAGPESPASLGSRSLTPGTGSAASRTPGTQGVSVGEFIEQVGAKRNPDKIVAMGVYLKDRGNDKFAPEEVRPLFQDAGESTPANFARDLRWAQNAKWIARAAGEANIFYVTKKGEQAVREGFTDEVRKATSQPARRRPRKRKPASRG